MKKKLLVALASAVVANSAMAQSAFEGFYGQLGIGYEHNSMTSGGLNVTQRPGEPDSGTPGTVGTPSYTGGAFSGAIGIGYNFSVAPKFLLGLGVDYSPLSNETSSASVCNGCTDSTIKYQVSNRFNAYLMPGFEIDKDKLVYLKAGYSMENIKAKPSFDNFNPSSNANGYIVGLGYKQLVTKNVYAFGEGNYMSYSKVNLSATGGGQTITANQTPSAYQFLVGVGYKF